ncbi:MAG TPA: energy transducer TonB [Terracidiphilus sp.]|jgi:protein TonB|nr:energy transducer TonB [Terracidiphilus sp.]
MFEDSTFESNGRIRTRSRRWMFATLSLNASILLALILIPLIYPEALPRQALTFLLSAPPVPETPPPHPKNLPAFHGTPGIANNVLFALPQIHTTFPSNAGAEQEPGDRISMDEGSAFPDGTGGAFNNHRAIPVIHSDVPTSVRLSSKLVEGMLLYKVTPKYPPIAVAAHMEGTVVLTATIGKNGTIENLRVASGPAMLQQAALDAVQNWRYRPYLLNGQPVEVETTVNVVFSMGR